MQCECVQPGVTGESGGGDGKYARVTYIWKERCRDGCRTSLLIAGGCSCSCHFSYFTTILPSLHHHSFCRNDFSHLYNYYWQPHA